VGDSFGGGNPGNEVSVKGDGSEEGATKASRFRRKKGRGDGVSEELYQSVRARIISGELSPTVAAIKKAVRGTTQAYLVIDRLQSERVVRQAENGRYQVA
jgi:hypothetical protein